VKCTPEEQSLLVEIRDLLAAMNEPRDLPAADAVPAAVSRAERALFLLERDIGDPETALVDIATAFDELAAAVGVRSLIARRMKGILERRRLR
jgi:hypothetical protein